MTGDLTYITVDEIRSRISARLRPGQRKCLIGLHAYPVGEHPHCRDKWFGVGPVGSLGTQSLALFDVRIHWPPKNYETVNEMVREACEQLGLQFIDMA